MNAKLLAAMRAIARKQAHARGERYTVTGTVKKHDTFQGEHQTVLTRCKLEEV